MSKKATKKDMTKKDEQSRTVIAKEAMLEALRKTLGVVQPACDIVGIVRTTYYRWLSEDENFVKNVQEVEELALDFVESKMMSMINGIKMTTAEGEIYTTPPDRVLIIFYLKTKGKRRGYIERQEHDFYKGGEPITGVEFRSTNPQLEEENGIQDVEEEKD